MFIKRLISGRKSACQVQIDKSGFSLQHIRICEGQVVTFTWEEHEGQGFNVTQVRQGHCLIVQVTTVVNWLARFPHGFTERPLCVQKNICLFGPLLEWQLSNYLGAICYLVCCDVNYKWLKRTVASGISRMSTVTVLNFNCGSNLLLSFFTLWCAKNWINISPSHV